MNSHLKKPILIDPNICAEKIRILPEPHVMRPRLSYDAQYAGGSHELLVLNLT